MDWIERLVDAGVSQVILDRGYDGDIDSLGRLADSFPGRLIVRADLPDPLFNRRNSRRNSSAEMVELANDVAALPLGGLAISAFSTDGFPEARLRFIEDLVDASDVPVFFRTEAASVGELHALEELGIAAAVLGSSLFNGQLDAESVARHFDS
jgi:phosphoribosylformimino-5-aminoimidazole carboxamide ribonucleotide (ProFAR) isomerase